jgi:hypothetical protein
MYHAVSATARPKASAQQHQRSTSHFHLPDIGRHPETTDGEPTLVGPGFGWEDEGLDEPPT